ncbi:MAG: peptidoglycan DD-metalloendopeptidase family protein [Thiogranum sp.]|nr:peptidoglycan DD-metalloendopeptidase family protein [Thiogranum sp.]
MKFLLYTTTHGKSGSIQLNRAGFWIPALLLMCAVMTSAGGVGYLLAPGAASAVTTPVKNEEDWQVALQEQKQELARARNEAQNQLNALAVRLGQMQAQMLRVEALGQRLTEVAKLDKSEFDFDQVPAQGGPSDSIAAEQLSSLDFMQALDDLASQMDERAMQLGLLEQVVSERELDDAVSPAGRPIQKGWLSSYYGMRTDPFHGRREMHKGIDFAGKTGDSIVATAAGVVTWADSRYGYGELVEINHGNGYSTRYGHCDKILVKVGDKVEPGDVIALMGSSGRSTGPHVHYEVLQAGKQVNPTRYIRASR